MKPLIVKITLLLTLILIFSSPYAGIYKWIDDDGNVHYGDHAENKKANEIKISQHKGPDAEHQQRMEKQKQYIKDGQKARNEKKKQRKIAKKEKKKKKLACKKIKKYLTKLEQHGRLYQGNKDGTRQYLSGPERDQEIAKTRKKVADTCR